MKIKYLYLNLLSLITIFPLHSMAPHEPQELKNAHNQYFIRWSPQATQADKDKLSKNQIFKSTLWTSELIPNLELIELNQKIHDSEFQQSTISQISNVEYSHPNYHQKRTLIPLKGFSDSYYFNIYNNDDIKDRLYERQWALNSKWGIQADQAWSTINTQQLREIKIAVIDTGIDTEHEDLKDLIIAPYNAFDDSTDVKDTMGHGTHVSGLIAANWNSTGIRGLHPKVKIIPIKAIPNNSDESDFNVIKAFEHAAKHGAEVINCSFGKKISGQAVSDIMSELDKKNIMVVMAAGNDSIDVALYPKFPSAFQNNSHLVVAATSSVSGALANFSNFNKTLVHIATPGKSILSTVPGNKYTSYSGTSMAAPIASGIIGLAKSLYPDLTNQELKKIILASTLENKTLTNQVLSNGIVDLNIFLKNLSN